VDERRRDLRVRGVPIELESKPWEVLHQLLLHAGEVVTKEELLDSVWPGLTVVDSSLATAISKLRKALGDDSMIVTLPRIGYRLAVPVQINATAVFESADLNLSTGQPVPSRDQWRLLRRLDKSPSSEVWLAEHPKTHELRVFKFAPAGLALRALKREVTLARLLHDSLGERPDFVRLLEWNFDKAPYFIESEYVGPNLSEWASAEGGLQNIETELRLSLLIDAVRAVAAAHSLDVLHKDLKPGNILVSKNSAGAFQIKIADFGSATLLSPSRLGALGITNLGFTHPVATEDSITGTVMYIAPEVLAGQSPSAASDVYALGVLLYQLMAGDFRKPLAPGWESDIDDPLLREDIADAACGDPARRIQSALELEKRLNNLERRRAERAELDHAQLRAALAERRTAQIRARLPWLLIAAVIPLALIAVFFALRRSQAPAQPRVKAVAVLPFQNIGSDTSLDYLRLALPDEIATALSHTRGLTVRPFATTRKYDQANLDLQQAGREIRVSGVVTGHFINTGDQLHITLEAIDVETNSVLWRDQIESPAGSMIATQVQIALRVRKGLAPALGASVTKSAAQPKNEEAYDLFLRGTALAFDLKSIREAIQLLERATQLDPDYARAWYALGVAYSREAHYTGGGQGSLERSDAANDRALALDPDYVDARITRVSNRVERGDLVRAYQEAEALVRGHPDKPGAHFTLMYVLRYAGLLEESARECEAGFSLDTKTPSLSLRSCAMVFLLQGDYSRASNFLSNYGNQYSGSDYATAISVGMLVRQGKEREALQLGLAHTPQWAGYDLLMACIQRKPAPEIRAMADAMRPSDDPEMNYLSAGHLAYCGRTEAALEMLRKAIKGNYCSYPAIDSDPLFTSLRTRPEFAEIRAAAIQCQNNFLSQRGR
jgi:serine/threonine protein kinase/DNA-binding winged helix-turn-helix (wHTH) protein/Flp pilus assembly protein TadD